MTDDLINRLRDFECANCGHQGQVHGEAADHIEAQAKEIERLREALEHIGIYGCGMLNQPPAMNGPEEDWLKQRIFEMERTARAALAGDKP